jgi:hypothetical protein
MVMELVVRPSRRNRSPKSGRVSTKEENKIKEERANQDEI